MNKKLKILLSAYACEPNRGSEPGVGWQWMQQISRFHDVWVITRANNQEVIEKETAKNPLPGVTFVYYDLPNYLKFWKRGNRGVHLYYYLWQIGIYLRARKLHRKVKFDVTHHVTFVNYWMPSFLPLLPVKFVWGPVGGGDGTPAAFMKSLSLRGKIYEAARTIATRVFEFEPFLRLAARRAAIALAVTEKTAERMQKLGSRKVELLSQVGLSQEEIVGLRGKRNGALQKSPFRVLSIGNLLHLKGYHLGIEAFAAFLKSHPNSEYWLVGDGPEEKSLEKLVEKLGVAKQVTFLGKIPRADVLKKLHQCHVLLHPSLHDSGAVVCAEAMGAGLPVICLALGGPAIQVTEETGLSIPAKSHEQVVTDITKALQKLATEKELAEKMGKKGSERVAEKFNWEYKGDRINQIYQEITA